MEHKSMDDTNEVGIITWAPPDPNWNPWLNQPVIIEGAEEYQVILNSSIVLSKIFYHLEGSIFIHVS